MHVSYKKNKEIFISITSILFLEIVNIVFVLYVCPTTRVQYAWETYALFYLFFFLIYYIFLCSFWSKNLIYYNLVILQSFVDW